MCPKIINLSFIFMLFVSVACDQKTSPDSKPVDTKTKVPPTFPEQESTPIKPAGSYFIKKNQWRLRAEPLKKSIVVSSVSWCEFDGTSNDTCQLNEWYHVVQNDKRFLVKLKIPNVRQQTATDLNQYYQFSSTNNLSSIQNHEDFLQEEREFSSLWNTLEAPLIRFSENFNLTEINNSQLIQHHFQTNRCRNHPLIASLAPMCPPNQGHYLVISRTLGGLPHYFDDTFVTLEMDPLSGDIVGTPLVVLSQELSASGHIPFNEESFINQEISKASGYKPSQRDFLWGAINPIFATKAPSLSSVCDATYNSILQIYGEIRSTPFTPEYSANIDSEASLQLARLLSDEPQTSIFSDTGESFPWTGKDPGIYPQSFKYFLENQTFRGGPCATFFKP